MIKKSYKGDFKRRKFLKNFYIFFKKSVKKLAILKVKFKDLALECQI